MFSSILIILDEILFVCFLPSLFKSNKTFSLSFLRISVLKAGIVFTQLKPPIKVFSNTQTCSGSVGTEIQHLLLSLRRLDLNISCK